MNDKQPEPNALSAKFNEKAGLSPDEKLAAMVKSMPEADRIAYQGLLDEQQQDRDRLTAQLEKDRPDLFASEYNEAYAKVTAPHLDYDRSDIPRPPSFYQQKAQQIAEQEVARQEGEHTVRLDTRQFEVRYNYAKHTTERIADREEERGKAREDFNKAGKGKDNDGPDFER